MDGGTNGSQGHSTYQQMGEISDLPRFRDHFRSICVLSCLVPFRIRYANVIPRICRWIIAGSILVRNYKITIGRLGHLSYWANIRTEFCTVSHVEPRPSQASKLIARLSV